MQLIAFVLVLPGLAFSVLLLLRLSTLEYARGQQAAEAAAVRTADTVDRELANIRAVLRVLATSPALAAADIPAFDHQARAVAATMGLNVVMTDRDGQQYINTRSNPGAPLPRSNVTDTLEEVVATGRPGLSDLYIGAVSGAPAVAVLMPVPEHVQPDWVLISSMQPSYLARLLQAQALPPGWVGVVVDGRGTIIARSVDHDRLVGRRASADLIEHAIGARGTWEGTTLEGTAVLAAYARVGGTEWRVAVGVPLEIMRAPFRATLAILTAAGAGSLALSLLLAWDLGRQIAGPLRALAVAGRRIGKEGAPAMPATGITEMDALAGTLAAASSDLLARTDALMGERARLAVIIDTVPVGLMIAASDGRILSGNAQFERTFRRSALAGGGIGKPEEWVAFHRDGQRVQGADHPLRRVLRGEDRAELTCQYQRGDGTRFWVSLVAAPIRLAPGTALAGVVVAILDIDEVVRAREGKAQFAETLQAEVAERTAALQQTNQRLRDEMSARAAAEDQLRQSQKMESVGRLTGGIAHDFNNLLTVVIGSLDLLGRRITEPKHRRLVENAMDGATRAATLTARLLAFSRQQPLQPQALDVNRLVDGMGNLLHRILGETVQVETCLAPDVWPVNADPNQLESALLNLAVNARDAMAQENGRTSRRLTITTANRVLEPGALPPDTLPGEYAEIAVADTGTGMAPEIVAQVFEPFFTTKPQGQGTGLGLSQVHGFVKQSGGSVVVDTAPGQGTTMRVLLPRLREPAGAGAGASAAPPEPHALPRAAGETILVVEDEAGVRRFTTEALRELGYVVIGGASAAEGMRLLQAHPEVSLLFTDIVLPDESGRLLAARAQRHRPRLPV
ncbi:MAG: ATP-binding protein, partial [Janthinobacterium lividum]